MAEARVAIRAFLRRTAPFGPAIAFVPMLGALTGCAGGMPLLHPARTLPTGDVRAAAGLSGQVALGSAADNLRTARNLAASDPTSPGEPGSNPAYAKGALVAAMLAPGIAPFISGRVGIGNRFEGGIAYTARAVRIDMRRSFDSGPWSLSLGVGGTGALYGRQQGSPLPNVDLSSLHGYGADIPLLVGWQSPAELYVVWAGIRGGFEYDAIEDLTSEPKSVTIGEPPIGLSATRWYGGGVVGLATGFRHVHVAIEIDAAYETASGSYNSTNVSIQGVSVTPATALWWTF